MYKVLWVGDGPDCPSGFGLATRKIVESLDYRQNGQFEVTVLGINHRGDPGTVPYEVFTAAPGGDWMGVGRLIWMCDKVNPDVIVIQQDPWNVPQYTVRLKQFKEHANIPIVGAVAVDGKNCQGKALNQLSHVIFWTQFALDEARDGGCLTPATIIPLGVDLNTYYPMDKLEARERKLPTSLDDKFIVGNVNRNQLRKRWDLTIKYFAEWIKGQKIDDAYLYLHCAPTGEVGCEPKQLAQYYGVLDRLCLVEPPIWYGVPEDEMRITYNCFDVQISTTQGEGFGLTTFEGMACGVPQILPDWSALGELCKDAAWMVPCGSTCMHGAQGINVVGGVPDQQNFTMALNRMYRDKSAREENSRCAIARANEPRYRWESIGRKFSAILEEVIATREQEEQNVFLNDTKTLSVS